MGEVSRREFLKAAGALPILASLPGADPGGGTRALGEWGEDRAGLPCYRYLGPVPSPLPAAGIDRRYLPEDPFFLIGNYRLTLLVHASGLYQILSGERAWGRLNPGEGQGEGQGEGMYTGASRATVTVGGTSVPLVGLGEPAARSAEKEFGVGYAQYHYRPAPGLRVTRTLSVLPSARPGDGTSAFVLSVALAHEGAGPLEVSWEESVRAAYRQVFAQWDSDRSLVQYSGTVAREPGGVRCDFRAHEPRPLLFSRQGSISRFEGAPPSLFVHIPVAAEGLETTAERDGQGQWIGVRASCSLEPGEEKVYHCVIGYAFTAGEIGPLVERLRAELEGADRPLFRSAWERVIPGFAEERDPALRREMRWNAGVLEQMATWRQFYDETVVPQGTVYDYQWGNMASSRDLAQQALPLCHTNPAIARSTLRYIMKRTIPDGEIKLDDLGFGWAPHSGRLTSDQQLYLFLLLNEYLRATGDGSILTERVSYYPVGVAAEGSGLDHVRDAFLFLRDRIGTGSHGLVKLWNSDWNDMFFFWPTTKPYNHIFDASESHMNTAMAIVVLGDLAESLRPFASSGEARELVDAVAQYRSALLRAFLADWGSRPFPRRMYFEDRAVGEEEMWLEPQGFTLLISDLPPERRRALYGEIEARLLQGQVMGPKQIERPVERPGTRAGSRENGGFWYALTGPVVLGAANLDHEAAMALLRRMTFANFTRHYPGYWTGQWSAADALDSAALPTAGLADGIPYCAHAHAWPLYCYIRLSRDRPGSRAARGFTTTTERSVKLEQG